MIGMEIGNIVRDNYQEPAEFTAIQDYVLQEYGTKVHIAARGKDIVIHAPNSALAATLRLEIDALRQAVNTKKKLIIRVGF